MAELNSLPILYKTEDLYASDLVDEILSIQTYYENQWIARGLTIKYLKFECKERDWIEPEIEIEQDSYRSFGRNNAQQLQQSTK